MSNTPAQQKLLDAIAEREHYRKIECYFPPRTMPCTFLAKKVAYAASLYKKHQVHFAAGKKYKQRMFRAGNRTGKTTAAGCELVYHLTGDYPTNWKGHKFTQANHWWLVGKSSKTNLDIFQPLLLGEVGDFGSGLIPRNKLDTSYMTAARKGDTLITDFRVKHVTGQWSTVKLKASEEGRKSFEGTERNIWIDEEQPIDIYQECLMRTLTGNCIMILTFTPLSGPTHLLRSFLGDTMNLDDGVKGPGKWCTTCSMDEVPHLDEKDINELLASFPEWTHDARRKGIPSFGVGAVYSIPEERIFIEPMTIPIHFKRVFAIDFGWSPDPTAILWGAIDPEDDVLYCYSESYLTKSPPSVHAEIIRTRNKSAGFSIPGVCDPSGGGRSIADGTFTRDVYAKEHGIFFQSADNSIAGVYNVYDRLNQGKIKVFNTCHMFKHEFRAYHVDEKGEFRGPDHLMDCLRYMVASGLTKAKSLQELKHAEEQSRRDYSRDLPAIYQHPDFWLYT
jgi:phage terminase large subunit-like protein